MIDKIVYKLYRVVSSTKKKFLLNRISYVGKDIGIGDYTVIQNPEQLTIGDYTQISDFTVLLALNRIEIGKNCRISTSCMITSVSHRIASLDRIKDDEVKRQNMNITIGNNVWIGANCVILPGTSIGDNSIIAASSVVKGNIPNDEIWGGYPASFRSKIIS